VTVAITVVAGWAVVVFVASVAAAAAFLVVVTVAVAVVVAVAGNVVDWCLASDACEQIVSEWTDSNQLEH